ncbi:MAG TPA: hypothetical protein PLU10_03315 [Chitinophagaceae bacterium]|nr:hypothetical protein [Chitinophagaceae bacterium]
MNWKQTLQSSWKQFVYWLPLLLVLPFFPLMMKTDVVRLTAFQLYNADVYFLPKTNITDPDYTKLAWMHRDYYRVIEKDNLANAMYYHFNDQEKIEVLHVYDNIGLALCKVHLYQAQPLTDTFKVVPVVNLHNELPATTI